jgi:selenocysteine lyase/cysteine desulfurase
VPSSSPPSHDPASDPLAKLVGAGLMVPCLDGVERPAVELDQAASTQALPEAAQRVTEFVPWYSSVHRGAGFRSRRATAAYEDARRAVLAFAGRQPDGDDDVAILCRNTTEAINQLAYRLRLAPEDVVVTTVVEHHANLLPWGRVARRRYVECTREGTFTVDDVTAALDQTPAPALLAVTGASNVTGWLTPLDEIIAAAHQRHIPVLVDAAQLAPHRPLPAAADYLVFSGHKLYAPFGSGALIGPRVTFETGEPFLAGGGAVDLVDLDEVVWTAPPDREEAGSPNVIGAVAMHAAIDALGAIGWERIREHERALAARLRGGLAAIPGVTLLGPSLDGGVETLPVGAFTVEGMHHALVAARLSAEYGVAVRHGCFCAHPYVIRLLGLGPAAIDAYRDEVLHGDHRRIPGAVRASAGLGTSGEDIDRLVAAVTDLAEGRPEPVPYLQDRGTGDFFPDTDLPGWRDAASELGASCSRG